MVALLEIIKNNKIITPNDRESPLRLFLFLLALLISTPLFAQDLPLNLLRLPPGFSIEIYAAPVPDARSMTLGPNGVIFVGSQTAGNVYAIIPDLKSPHGTRVLTIAKGLTMPNGVAFYKGSLYIAEISRIRQFDFVNQRLVRPRVITASLPTNTWHGWRYIAFGPDKKLYIAIGMPCNVCLQKDPRFGTISRMNADGSQFEIFVKGLRNSVGFDWDPLTQNLWLTDNGRDWMGDNLPPDKLNYAPTQGLDFGFPYTDGQHLPNPDYGKPTPAQHFTQPTYELPAHVAPLGMKFYNGTQFPPEYQHHIFMALHGSWNRSSKVGYEVMNVEINKDHVIDIKPFITGWLQGQQAWGRPVDTLILPDGSLLISDDFAGVIYRVKYTSMQK
jgi:glucose/arabinose dehydrogenase